MPATLAAAAAAVLLVALTGPAAGAEEAGDQGVPEELTPLSPPPPAPTGDGLTQPADAQVAPDRWFVELEAAPTAQGGTLAAQKVDQAEFRVEAAAEGIDAEVEQTFSTLWHGATVRADGEEAAALAELDSVVRVSPVAIVPAPEPEETGIAPELATALGMTGADVVQSELGFTGTGVSVGVIDTGIDYNHPDFGGNGDPDHRMGADPDTREFDHPRISHGWDYVGDEFDSSNPDSPPPAPDQDPFDSQSHGTHVSGIVGASAAGPGGATGVAPGVTLGAYKVFGAGSTTSDVIVAALEDAFADGMDVVNMSLGATLAWGQEYPTAQAANELANNGTVVVNSAGNSGPGAATPLGLYALSAPANAHDIISVASADNTFTSVLSFAVDQLDEQVPYVFVDGAEAPPTEGRSQPLALPAETTIDVDGEVRTGFFGCQPEDWADFPAGHDALVQRFGCGFADKYANAVAAGASGVLIYNHVDGLLNPTIADAGVEGIWSAFARNVEGDALAALVQDGETVTLGFTEELVSIPNPTARLVSGFSSFGPDVELGFGPSVLAPGGLIRSTVPLHLGGHGLNSGTSMASPHVAGAVALLLQAEPDLDPFQVRDRLQNAGDPELWWGNPGLGFLDNTFRQGAGMIQIDDTILADQHASPGQLALGDENQVSTTITLTNRADSEVTFQVGHTPALSAGVNSFNPSFFAEFATVGGPETVTVPAGGSAEVAVTITAPATGLPNHHYGGYLTFTADGATVQVPYHGYEGDYVDELGLFGFWQLTAEGAIERVEVDPLLAQRLPDGSLAVAEPGHVYRPRTGDNVIVAPFFGHFPQQLELYATSERTGRTFLVLAEENVARTAQVGFVSVVEWDGRAPAGANGERRPLPPGTYTLELRVLRALGDAGNPDHWDSWQSPELVIDHAPPRP